MSKAVTVFTSSDSILLQQPVSKIKGGNEILIETKTLLGEWVSKMKQIRICGSTFNVLENGSYPLIINGVKVGELVKA